MHSSQSDTSFLHRLLNLQSKLFYHHSDTNWLLFLSPFHEQPWFKKTIGTTFALFIAVLMTGCADPQPVVKTHYEYIPPFSAEGLTCTRAVKEKFIDCLGIDKLKADVCRKEEERIAWGRYRQAQVRYQSKVSQAKADRQTAKLQRQDNYLSQQGQYEICKGENLKRKNKHEKDLKIWRAEGQKGMRPTLYIWNLKECNAPQMPTDNYSDNLLYVSGNEPRLGDFIYDAKCYGNTECLERYHQDYESCTGKVIKKTRCFINCDKTK